MANQDEQWVVTPLDEDDEAPEDYVVEDELDGEPVTRIPVDSCDGATVDDGPAEEVNL